MSRENFMLIHPVVEIIENSRRSQGASSERIILSGPVKATLPEVGQIILSGSREMLLVWQKIIDCNKWSLRKYV